MSSSQNYGGFAGGPELLVVVNAETYEPKLLVPTGTTVGCDEDSSVKVNGFEVQPNAAGHATRAHVLHIFTTNESFSVDDFTPRAESYLTGYTYTYTCVS